MTYAKYLLKFCAIGLYFILIATCVPTVFAQSQDDTHPCLLSVNKVTPLDVSLWTGAALFAPEILENIEIIYTYPIDDVPIDDVTKSSNFLLIGKRYSDKQLLVEGWLSSFVQKNDIPASTALSAAGTMMAFSAGRGAILDIEDRLLITRDQIQDLADYSGEKRHWTLNQSWESAITHHSKKREYSQIEVNPDILFMPQGASPLLSCLDAESVE